MYFKFSANIMQQIYLLFLIIVLKNFNFLINNYYFAYCNFAIMT